MKNKAKNPKMKMLLAAAGMALSMGSANAAVLMGNTVQFSFDDSLLDSLFGTFSVNGDNLEFSQHNFSALANGNLFGSANATTPLINVTAKSGYTLSGVSLFEQGDYYRIETAPDSSFVSVGGQFIVNNNATNFSSDQVLNSVLSFSALGNGAPLNTAWTVSESVALNAAAATVKVENLLVAGALPNISTAFIEKKLVSIGAFTVPVPVPTAAWLFLSGLVGFISISKRKQNLA